MNGLARNEIQRLAAVQRYEILDTPPDGSFDRLTSIAARLFSVPIAIISLVDHDRIWFKSRHGLDVEQIGRDPGLCASAVLHGEPWIVTDAANDPRTLSNPLVAGAFGLRFYVGAPLRTQDGFGLGTLCVIDRKPRPVTEAQIAYLEDLACIVMDQMELRLATRRAVSEIAALLRTDVLTELPNRRGFDEHIEQELDRHRSGGPPFCIAIIDIDHFKSVNDELGHDAGDTVLREVAAVLRGGVRRRDFLARWGGEEFVLVLAVEDGLMMALLDRLRAVVERHAIPAIGRALTVSIGATQVRPDELSAVALKRADEALYLAKQSGRNRVVEA
jgi:diguanylate cyclase (GGDEF)-like protein